MYPALLVLMVGAVAVAERTLRRSAWARPWLELVALVGVAWVGNDIAHIARVPITHMFSTPMPAVADSTGPFHTEVHIPPSLAYQSDWAPATLTAVLANVSTTDCGTYPAFHNYFRDHLGHIPGLGAHGVGDPGYKGEAYVAEGAGKAEIVSFTPNEITVVVHGATPGDHVVLNQNWDAGWSARGARTANLDDQVSATIDAPEQTFVFRYRPLAWWPGLALFFATVGGVVWAWRRRLPASA
jgi:hypothetical protein